MTAFVKIGDVEKQVSLHLLKPSFTEATTVNNGNPLAFICFYVPSMLLMYEC